MKRKHCFWYFLLLGAAFGFISKQEPACERPILISGKLEITYSEEGRVKFRLFTEEALHYENGDRAYPAGVRVEFYKPEEEEGVVAVGRADRVYFFADKNVYEFRGNVSVKSMREQKQLKTEELHWHPETETLHTTTFIRMEAGDELLTGEGLTAGQDLSHYSIPKPQGVCRVESIK